MSNRRMYRSRFRHYLYHAPWRVSWQRANHTWWLTTAVIMAVLLAILLGGILHVVSPASHTFRSTGTTPNPTRTNQESIMSISGDYDQDVYPEQDSADLNLGELWSAFASSYYSSIREDFRAYLRTLVSDPDAIDEVSFCGDCGRPEWDDELTGTGTGDSICESCRDSRWSGCDSCGELYPDGSMTDTLNDCVICDGCLNDHYSWCDNCDGYYHDDDYEHNHDDEHDDEDGYCGCEPPQPEFTIRNDGCEPLAQDTRVTVALPAGTISDVGLDAIRQLLITASLSSDNYDGMYNLAWDLESLGSEWQTKTGNFAKRLSRHAYQRYQIKLTPDVLSSVGTIARDHSNAVSVQIEVTRDLNQSAGYFYHEDSCWWGSYGSSRCAFKTNGGFGLRSFDGDSQYSISGRAWVMPLRRNESGRLIPTFDTVTPDAFVVFNGYGDLSGYAAPRILAHMAGWTYRKIGFECSPMYVNAGGYLVAPEDIAEKYTDGSLTLSVSQHAHLFEDERALVNA